MKKCHWCKTKPATHFCGDAPPICDECLDDKFPDDMTVSDLQEIFIQGMLHSLTLKKQN